MSGRPNLSDRHHADLVSRLRQFGEGEGDAGQRPWAGERGGVYRAVETETYHMDVFAGARTTILDVELTGRFAHGGEATVGRDTDWTDPIVGIRGQAALSEKLFFRYYGDIGGFGASSDLTWQTCAGIGDKITGNRPGGSLRPVGHVLRGAGAGNGCVGQVRGE